MIKFKKTIIFLSLISNMAYAETDAVYNLTKALGIEIDERIDNALPGYSEVKSGREHFYIHEGGRHFIVGEAYSMDNDGNIMLDRNKRILSKLQDFGGTVLMKPKGVKKSHVTVFTDFSCGYCQALHKKIDEYLDAGITIEYAAFPRAGVNSKVAKHMAQSWCEDFTNISNSECLNIINNHYEIGKELGVKGTPSFVTDSGIVYEGVVPVNELKTLL